MTRKGWPIQEGVSFGVVFGDGLGPDGGGGGGSRGECEGEGVVGLRLGLVDLRRPRRMGVMEGMMTVLLLGGHDRGVEIGEGWGWRRASSLLNGCVE